MGIGYIAIAVFGLAFIVIAILEEVTKQSQVEDPAARRRRLAYESMVAARGPEAAQAHLEKLRKRYPDWKD